MGILIWIIFGLVAGSVARLMMPGPRAGGMAVAILLGIGGALIGGLLGTVFGGAAVASFDVGSLLFAISTTLLVLLCYRSYALRAAA